MAFKMFQPSVWWWIFTTISSVGMAIPYRGITCALTMAHITGHEVISILTSQLMQQCVHQLQFLNNNLDNHYWIEVM